MIVTDASATKSAQDRGAAKSTTGPTAPAVTIDTAPKDSDSAVDSDSENPFAFTDSDPKAEVTSSKKPSRKVAAVEKRETPRKSKPTANAKKGRETKTAPESTKTSGEPLTATNAASPESASPEQEEAPSTGRRRKKKGFWHSNDWRIHVGISVITLIILAIILSRRGSETEGPPPGDYEAPKIQSFDEKFK